MHATGSCASASIFNEGDLQALPLHHGRLLRSRTFSSYMKTQFGSRSQRLTRLRGAMENLFVRTDLASSKDWPRQEIDMGKLSMPRPAKRLQAIRKMFPRSRRRKKKCASTRTRTAGPQELQKGRDGSHPLGGQPFFTTTESPSYCNSGWLRYFPDDQSQYRVYVC